MRLVKNIKNILKTTFRKIFKPKIINNHTIKILFGGHINNEIKNSIYSGSYEGGEIKILKTVLNKYDKVIEIGAGLGFLTSYCAKHIGNNNILSFEANPNLIKKIKENFKLNQVSPEIRNQILSDNNDSVSFYLEDSFWSSSTIKRSKESKEITMETINVNEVIKEFQPNFLIIDIEGGESTLIYQINIWGEIRKILIEFHPHIIGNYECTKIISHLNGLGFELNFDKTQGNVLFFSR